MRLIHRNLNNAAFISHSLQQIDELQYAIAGGEVDEQRKETTRYLTYNTIFTPAIQASQGQSEIKRPQPI